MSVSSTSPERAEEEEKVTVVNHNRKNSEAFAVRHLNEILDLDLAHDADAVSTSGYLDGYATDMILLIVNKKLRAKAEYSYSGNKCKIHWLCGRGFGGAILEALENHVKSLGVTIIVATVSLIRSEKDSTIMRRLNFYYKHNFKAMCFLETDPLVHPDVTHSGNRIIMMKRIDGGGMKFDEE